MSKRQSPTTVLFRTTLTQTITQYELLILLGSNHLLFYCCCCGLSQLLYYFILLGMVASGQSSVNLKCGNTYAYQFPAGEGRSFFCHPTLKGRYVIIRFVDKDKALTLCEVEVYSERRGMMNVNFL